jgi:hypothetical protein
MAALFQRVVERREIRVDFGFYPGDGDENSKRDACGDEAVFNGRCGSLIRNEPADEVHRSTVNRLTEPTVPLSIVKTGSITRVCV